MELYTIEVFTLYTAIVIILILSLFYHTYFYADDPLPIPYDDEKPIKKENTYRDYIATAHSGLLRGMVFGIILGDLGLVSGIRNAAIYGTINPLFLYMGY